MKRRLLVASCIVLAGLELGTIDPHSARPGGLEAPGSRLPVIVHRGATLAPPAQSEPVPLVIGLPATGGTPSSLEKTSGLDAVADEHGFVVAYLSSTAPFSPAWTLDQMPGNLSYVSSEISQLIKQQNIDPDRVYVTGFSAGATMSFSVGCQLSSQVAGIAPVSGAMRPNDPCKLARPVSELLIIGTNDVIPLKGSSLFLSVDDVAARWRAMNSCSSQSSQLVSSPTTATTWDDCNDAGGVGLNVILGGTHQWPGAPQATGVGTQYNAAEAIWAFFAAHPGTSATTPSTSVTSLAVGHSGLKRWVRVVLSAQEHGVSLRAVLTRRGRAVTSKAFMLDRATRQSKVLQLPTTASGGRYVLTLSFVDSYARRATVTRSLTIPNKPKPN